MRCCFVPTDAVDDEAEHTYMCAFIPLPKGPADFCHAGERAERRPATVDEFMVACHLEQYTEKVKALGVTDLELMCGARLAASVPFQRHPGALPRAPISRVECVVSSHARTSQVRHVQQPN